MNTITFLALLITAGYAVKPVPESHEFEVRGSFGCTYNKDAVAIELRYWNFGNDDKVDSKNVSVGDSFLLFGGLPWFNIEPYIVIRHRCNPCNKDTMIQYRLNFSQPELQPRTFNFGVINMDNLESSRCLKEL